MPSRFLSITLLVLLSIVVSGCPRALAGDNESVRGSESNNSRLTGIEFQDQMSFNVVSSSGNNGCSFPPLEKPAQSQTGKTVKLQLKRRSKDQTTEPKVSVAEFRGRDSTRIWTLHRRITEKKNQNTVSRLKTDDKRKIISPLAPRGEPPEYDSGGVSGQLVATLESGMTLGSGEYFMDVFVGTPPRHFSLILDTGSDLNWIQCLPCHDCFEQDGPFYNPKDSGSFRHITCHDPRCGLVSSPDPPQPCKAENQSCPYYYWYGDSSNTTGDFALETFTVNLTTADGSARYKKVENVMFGCGHWNRGLFHGAAGLLGLGRGPLSFSSQLQSLYGHSFSYCLVDRNSDTNVSSKLIFGEDKDLLRHPHLNFTSFVAGKDNPVDTFYYVHIKQIIVGGEALDIPQETWNLSPEGDGGTIVDSGTTLSYFADPAYEVIKNAFIQKAKGKYPTIRDFPILDPCFNVSGVKRVRLPDMGIVFADGALWHFPQDNCFIRLEEDVACLAILGTPRSALSIIGNYQQQNFHILYDTKTARLGFAPMNCAGV